jgi:hypothetical protein
MTVEKAEETDLVITYTVHSGPPIDDLEYKRMQAALKEGCRVIDVIPTTTTVGGSSSGHGTTVITVILEKPAGYHGSRYHKMQAK